MKILLAGQKNSSLLLLPAVAAAWVAYAGIEQTSGSNLLAIGCALTLLAVFYGLWRAVFTSIALEDDAVVIERNGPTITLSIDDVRRVSTIQFRPAYTVMLIIWHSEKKLPTVTWSGFVSSNVGNFSETVSLIKSSVAPQMR